jgi:hypothetical protein
MIFTALCIMFWMNAYPLQVGEGWAPNGIRLWDQCHFTGPKKLSIFRAQPPPTCPRTWICAHPKHYAQGCINHRCIVTIYAPLSYTSTCVMFLIREETLCGQVRGGLPWKSQVFLGPVKASAIWGPKNSREVSGPILWRVG